MIRYAALLIGHARKEYMLRYLYVDDISLQNQVIEECTLRWCEMRN